MNSVIDVSIFASPSAMIIANCCKVCPPKSSGLIVALGLYIFFIRSPIRWRSSNIKVVNLFPFLSIIPAAYSPIAVTIASLKNSLPANLGYLFCTFFNIARPCSVESNSFFKDSNNLRFLRKIAFTHGCANS